MEIKSLIVDMRKRLTKKNRRILKKIVEPKTWIVHTYLSLINFLSFDEDIVFLHLYHAICFSKMVIRLKID